MWYMKWVETNRVPDWLIRLGIRANLESGLRRRYQAGLDEREAERLALLARLRQSPIAIDADLANQQHYEVPAFVRQTLAILQCVPMPTLPQGKEIIP
jgi:cyclopropane-fatty-acyl-phospholipid synthase